MRVPSLIVVVAFAVGNAVQAESLTDAWALALANDRSLAALEAQAASAADSTLAARAQRLPSFTAGIDYVQFQDAPAFRFPGAPALPEIVDDDDALLGSVSATLPLFTSGRVTSSIAAALAQQRSTDAARSRAAQELKLGVADAYVNVLRGERALQVAESTLDSLSAYEREVRSMFDRESVPRNDLLAAAVAVANARQQLIRADNRVKLARAGYNRRLGQPLDRPLRLEATLPALDDSQQRTLAELTGQALRQRQDIAMLAAQADSAGSSASVEAARARPQVQLTASYTHLENTVLDRENFAFAGVGVSWALFDGGSTRHRAAALRRTQRALEHRRADLETLIALEVQQAMLERDEARSRIAVTADAVAQAEENLRITREQYRAGLVTSTRVFEAETLRVQSRTNYDDATLDAQLAIYRLACSIGTL